MPTKTTFILTSLLIFQFACIVKFNSSSNNVWKIPGTDLQIVVEKKPSEADKKMVARFMILRENYSEKIKFPLARTGDEFSRLNIYQTTEKKTYLIQNLFNSYELNAETKTLQKISAPTAANERKFIGAFDDNENGDWRFILASERAEIPLEAK